MRTLLVLGAVMLLLAVGIACRNGETEEQQEQPVKSENADIVVPQFGVRPEMGLVSEEYPGPRPPCLVPPHGVLRHEGLPFSACQP